jgi:hypothetical protein
MNFLSLVLGSLFSVPSGFGTAGIRRQRICGALTYFGSATAQQRGVESPETGINVSRFEVDYYPEVDEENKSNIGETNGAVISSVPSRDITIEGRVTGTTGRMADTFTSAVTTIANDITTFGGTGGVYLKRARETQSEADWRSATLNYRSRPGLA